MKNIFSTDSDLMIIPQDLIFDFVLCTCRVFRYTLPSTENISADSNRRGSSGKVLNEKLHLNNNGPPTLSKRLNEIIDFQDCNWGSKIYLLYRNQPCWDRHLLCFQSLLSVWFWVVSGSIQSWIEICLLDQQNQWERWEQKKWKLFLKELNFW